jgi:hypothetical protein
MSKLERVALGEIAAVIRAAALQNQPWRSDR